MKILIPGVLGAFLAVSTSGLAAARPIELHSAAVVLPLSAQADTSDALAAEATQAFASALKKDGVAVDAISPALPGGKACLSRNATSARACAAAVSATGSRYAFAGSVHAYAYMTRANLPVRMTVTLFDTRSGQPVWTGAYGDGPKGDFSRAVSAYGDLQIGARTLAAAFIADPTASSLLYR